MNDRALSRRGQGPARKNAAVLLFEARGTRLGVFIAEVGSVLVERPLTPVPFSHPALAGLHDDESGAIPVFDLRALVEGTQPSPHVEDARIALFETERGPVGLRMDHLLGAHDDYRFITDVNETTEMRAAIPERLLATITGFADMAGGPFAFFSPDAFLHTLDIGLASRPATKQAATTSDDEP